ncbi:hypothetical protein [Micromonospora sp. HM134]|uniref:hypothetical protein n=1 Tax=Micromonospora sp. HM134 TaxID=2583243 RepID=UPI00143D5D4C|nr:hypothetical protein [Micromonospora sp. HM134]
MTVGQFLGSDHRRRPGMARVEIAPEPGDTASGDHSRKVTLLEPEAGVALRRAWLPEG